MDNNQVAITLSGLQVEQILQAAATPDNGTDTSGLQFVLTQTGWTIADVAQDPLFEDRGISQTLVLGLLVLASFPADGGEQGVRMLAGSLGMAPSTIYRFLKTLVAIGLLERNAMTREYRLPRK